ncbi:MAG: peptide chain release factor N(5)-glutamine methyltransferase [Parvularculaceae bacterium]|nr:peptide chain release factor N(5)-glutamine methyltransferase [Parvularculaceae bacterium]
MTIDAAIRRAAAALEASSTPALDARVLAKAAFGLDDATLIAQGDRIAAPEALARYGDMIARRAAGEPVAHIVGRREFWSLDIEVAPPILVPRADSETIVEAVVRRRAPGAPLKILDLGCGSGALLCALLAAFPKAVGVGVDVNPEAVALTSRNLLRLGFGLRSSVKICDWFAAVDGRFDVIVSNPPYIRTVDRDILPREVRDFEDPGALFSGEDGLDAHRLLMADAPRHIAPGGLFVVEFGEGQLPAINDLARRAFPGAEGKAENDLSGRPRAFVIDLGAHSD